MTQNLKIVPSPHMKSGVTTKSIMLDVVIALIPALIASTFIFGLRALLLTAACVLSCVVFEYLFRRLLGRENTIGDCSAIVTGMLLAYNLPSTLPVWMAVIGSFVAIVLVKQLFGGIGQNFANPALVGRIVLMISFAKPMSAFLIPTAANGGVDAVAGATPLKLMGDGKLDELPGLLDMFLGVRGGVLGETCILALLLGAAYLLLRKVITPVIPVAYLGTVALMCWALGADVPMQLMSGGLVLGAFFMATDYSTSPTTNKGKLIFGIGCGVITTAIRLYGSYAEGVSFAILLMNILCPLIDRYTKTKPFGGAAK